jgi:hypothetical protein
MRTADSRRQASLPRRAGAEPFSCSSRSIRMDPRSRRTDWDCRGKGSLSIIRATRPTVMADGPVLSMGGFYAREEPQAVRSSY